MSAIYVSNFDVTTFLFKENKITTILEKLNESTFLLWSLNRVKKKYLIDVSLPLNDKICNFFINLLVS